MRIRSLFCILLLFTLPASASDITYPVVPLDILTHDARLHSTVEVATTDDQHEQGLMYRKNLPNLHGMIFVFREPRHVVFWMKNTLIPLDMLFIGNDGIVSQIVENAKTESTTPIPSRQDVRAVIELGGGTAQKYHIATGDRIIYPVDSKIDREPLWDNFYNPENTGSAIQ
jgi:uncharacterized membrane protein (UPF0127 family)